MGVEINTGIMHHDESVASKLQRLVSSQAYQYQRQRMLEMLVIPDRSQMVLDVGCGEGAFCRDLRRRLRGSSIFGLDISPFVIGIAKEHELSERGSVNYLLGDARSLPFPENTFDIVVFAGTLKYLKTEEAERDALLHQVHALRPGGQLLVVDSDDDTISYKGVEVESDLSKKIVDAYAVLQGDLKAGSRIKSLCQSIGLENIQEEIILLEETEFTPVHAGQAMAQNIRDVLKKLVLNNPAQSQLPGEEIEEFYNQLVRSEEKGNYKWSYTKHAVIGKKPD